MSKARDLENWTCQGQTDLTELVDNEHIAGSMPADEAENEAARQRFYATLTQPPEATA